MAADGDQGRTDIDILCIDTIRTLAMDAVQKAKSGHPGTPMALAPVAYTLWQSILNYDPADPTWPNRDRFVLSVGHASMLLYALLHLSGVRKIDENGHCAFEVSGTIHAGPNVSVPGFVGVSFVDRYTIYDTAKMLFGDAVTKVDGLGTEAWYALTAVHAKVAGGELVVSGLWVGNFNRDTLKADTITLAKTILARP